MSTGNYNGILEGDARDLFAGCRNESILAWVVIVRESAFYSIRVIVDNVKQTNKHSPLNQMYLSVIPKPQLSKQDTRAHNKISSPAEIQYMNPRQSPSLHKDGEHASTSSFDDKVRVLVKQVRTQPRASSFSACTLDSHTTKFVRWWRARTHDKRARARVLGQVV